MLIRDYLDYRVYDSDPEGDDEPWVYVETDPLYQFAHVVGDEGNPVRHKSIVRVQVPMQPWLEEEENDIIFRTMNEAAKDNLRRAQNFAGLNSAFWAKCSPTVHALVTNSANEGRFSPPPGTPVFYTEEVPQDRVVGVGPREQAGIYLVRGDSRGFIAKRKQGLVSILVNQV